MPVLRFSPGRVEEVLRLPLEEALRVAERLKIEAEIASDGMVEFEVEVDRPDMFCLEGIARQADGILGRARGLPRYELRDSGYTVRVDGDVAVRPYILAAAVWGVDVDEEYLRELIQFQEKLHLSLGGDRKYVAIGLHDLDKLPSKTLYYRLEPLDSVRFTPLGYGEEMTLGDVLEKTEQGAKYGRIALSGRMHPVLYSGDTVISVPPVINAEATRIKPGTRNIFIDVTGTNKRLVRDTLYVLAAGLAERSKAKTIGIVRVERPGETLAEPRMEPRGMSLEVGYASSMLGTRLSAREAAAHLERMRFDARSVDENLVAVRVPAYRIDVIHPVDLVEEIMLSIGVDNITPEPPRMMLRGRLLRHRYWEREARKLLAGMGFVETVSYSLVDCGKQASLGGVRPEELVRLANPLGPETACLRATLLPQLLELAVANQQRVPIRVYELAETLRAGQGGVEPRKTLGILVMADKAGYEDIQAVVYTLIRLLGDEIVSIREATHPILIEGRAATLRTREGVEAVLGEVKPEILEKLGITYPVALAEIDYTALAEEGVPRP